MTTPDDSTPRAEASTSPIGPRIHLRIARATNDIDALRPFYCDGLGFDVLGGFEDHEGFDGLMLGHETAGYHLEFTRQRGHDVDGAPTKENLLVFYLGDEAAERAAVDRMQSAGFEPVASHNPYWDRCGTTFEDPDGYRVVLVRGRWV